MTGLSLDPEIVEGFRRLGAALAIGLLIGIERGWKDRDGPEGSRTAGVRTFTLIGLLGGVASLVAQEFGGLVFAIAFLGFAGAMTAVEIQHARRVQTSDATTLVAALLVFGLAAYGALGNYHVSAAAAVAMAAILAFKDNLHGWLEKLTFEELRAGLVIAAMTVIILPLLPAEPIDPWDSVSLRTVWLLTIMIAAISFVGYAAIRVIGPERGPLIAGIAGGLVSSTATVVSLSRMARRRRRGAPPLIAGAVAANTVMFVRVGIVAGALRPDLIVPLAAALVPATLVSAAATAYLALRPKSDDAPDPNGGGSTLELKNPLSLMTALVFGVLLAVVSMAAAVLEMWVGDSGVYALAAVSGLADVDAITLSMTQSADTPIQTAAIAILIVVAVNTASKAVMARFAGGPRAGLIIMLTSAAALLAGAIGYFGVLKLAAG